MPTPSETVVTYEIIYLRRENVMAQKHISGEWWYVEKQPCRHQGLWKMGSRCSRDPSKDSPPSCGADYGEVAVSWHQRSTYTPWTAPHQSRWCLKDIVTLWKIQNGASFLPRSVTSWRTYAAAVCSVGLHPVEETLLEQFVKNCSPWKGLMMEKFRGLSPMGGSTRTGGGSEEFYLWGGRSSRDSMWWTDCSPHFLFPVPLWGKL